MLSAGPVPSAIYSTVSVDELEFAGELSATATGLLGLAGEATLVAEADTEAAALW